MHETDLVERVKSRIGAATDADAETAIEATLMTLGERMTAADAAVVAAELPPRFAKTMRLRAHDPGLGSLAEFYARVARRAQLPQHFGVEHAQAVCRALCELLGHQGRAQLCIDVWPELVRPSLEDHLAPVVATHGRRLSTGRPGSGHPLSEARPERAHEHSVARRSEPHAARKLSSGAPAYGDTLADSTPGSRHPVSEGRPR